MKKIQVITLFPAMFDGVFNSAMMWSRINGLPVNSFELRGKYHKKNYFFSLGYEHLKIASPNYNFVTLGTGIYF